MSFPPAPDLSPRKTPVQTRSTVTVAAIHEAGIQVLLAGGYARFTTSRVAERAGVSIGSIYQYYPNKAALLAALLNEHLSAVVSTVERACEAARGAALESMLDALVTAFLDAKTQRVEVSLALYAPMAQADGAALVRAAGARAAKTISGMLETCADVTIPAPHRAAAVLATTLSALMQSALEAGPGQIDVSLLRKHMTCMGLGYLRTLAESA